MDEQPKSLNDKAWEKLFEKYNILNKIASDGVFRISSSQIKEFREPRLMAKFDHTINLPKIFLDNGLAILPITRGDYIISNIRAYHKFEDDGSATINKASLPEYIQSIDPNSLTSETIALNCAVASGIIDDFLEDEDLVSTVSGRMGSGEFNFNISNPEQDTSLNITVKNSQIEIDGAYEGVNGLAIFEAKRDLSEDFLIRQLYYPYRTLSDRVSKKVRPIFLVYSNGIYRIFEYAFEDKNDYNSLVLVKQKNYSIEDTLIKVSDIEEVIATTSTLEEPEISFPQADRFERVINLCELLSERGLSRSNLTERYAFDSRQTNYYTDAARYLGLVGKVRSEDSTVSYKLTDLGKEILCMPYKQRQLEFCKLIIQHRAFAVTLSEFFDIGSMPTQERIVEIMKESELYNIESDSTFIRRSSTVRGWVNWITSLINE